MHGESAVPWRDLLWFGGWLAALLVLMALGLRLPLQTRLPRFRALAYTWGIVVVTLGLAVLANIALALHDAHLDLTRERTFPQSAEAALPGQIGRAHVRNPV